MARLRPAFVLAALGAGAAIAVACTSYEEASPVPLPDGGAPTDSSAPLDASDGSVTPPTWLPKEGIYRYRVDGRQELDVADFDPLARDEGPVVPAEIRREPGKDCWTFRICFVSGKCDDKPSGAYSDLTMSFCVQGGKLELTKAREKSRWLLWWGAFQDAVSEMTCTPGQAMYATTDLSMMSWSHVCQGAVDGTQKFSSSGPYRYLGQDTVTVGNVSVPAFHFVEQREVKDIDQNAPKGTQLGEYWLAANGLPVRMRRGVVIDTNVGFGNVRFTQEAKQPPPDAGPNISMNDCVLDALEPTPLPVIDAGLDAGPPDSGSADADSD